jgi:hypothetical protein
MLAIADAGGEEWGRKAREAAKAIASATTVESDGANLLADIRTAFETERKPEILSRRLIELLTADPESRWCECGRDGKPITPNRLGKLLRKFSITSTTVHPPGEAHGKGYRRSDFEESWARYLPPETHTHAASPLSEACKRASADGMGITSTFQSVQETKSARFENANLSYSHAGLHACTLQNGGNGNVCASDDVIAPSSAPETPPWTERQISTSPEDRRPPGETPPAPVDLWEEAGKIPDFLRRSNGDDRAPPLGPPGDSLDDFQ